MQKEACKEAAEVVELVKDAVLAAGMPVDIVLLRETWIIVQDEAKRPRLEKLRYFSFSRRSTLYEGGGVEIVVTTVEAENYIREFVENEMGFTPFSPGAADPSSVVGVWV